MGRGLAVERAEPAEPSVASQRSRAPVPNESLPVLDPAPLLILTGCTGDKLAQRFFRQYLDQLPPRVSTIIRSLIRGHAAAFEDAVVNLKVTSALAGAVRMEHYCRELQNELAAGSFPDLADVFVGMSKTAKLIYEAAEP